MTTPMPYPIGTRRQPMFPWLVVVDYLYFKTYKKFFEINGIDAVLFDGDVAALTYIDKLDSGELSGPLPAAAIIFVILDGKHLGNAVAKRIRQSDRLRDIPIILTSEVYSGELEAYLLHTCGADVHLPILWPPPEDFEDWMEYEILEIRGKRADRAIAKDTMWMVVTDDADYHAVLAMYEIWNFDGLAFFDGAEPVAWVDDVDAHRYSGRLPDAAIIHMRLPGSVPWEQVVRRIRQSPRLANMAIILTGGWGFSQAENDQFERSGVDAFIPMPWPRINEMQAMVDRIVAQKRLAVLAGNA